MPKRLLQQRRGKGKSIFLAKGKYDVKYKSIKNNLVKGKIIDILHDNGRTAPVMLIKYENGEKVYLPAIYGMKVGDIVSAGSDAEIKPGNILPLSKIPDGTNINDVELIPGDGGKLIRSAGASAKVIAHEGNNVIIKLPSKAFKVLNKNCRATIGIIGGAGRREKPLLKAGNHHHLSRARGKYWPNVSGVKKNPVEHPFGGKRRRTGRTARSTSRNAPPGRKVGSIASKRTGRKKR